MQLTTKNILRQMSNNFETTKTIEFLESFLGMSLSEKSRKRSMVEARMIYAKLMKVYTRTSLSDIGRAIGKDHATIIHYLTNFKWLKKTDQAFSSKYDTIADMYEEFRATWFNEDRFDDKKQIQLLKSSIEKMTTERDRYEKYFKKIQRIDSIVQLIEERTPRGEEEYVESKINRMFNSIVFNP
jgi:hypothetical protein